MKPINHFPRNFCSIRGTIRISVSDMIAGETIHITRNDYGLLAYFPRTNTHAYVLWNMIRDPELFTVTEIVK